VAGDFAFVADRTSGLQLIDITDPTNPTLAGTYDTPGEAQGVVVAGDLAFVADYTAGLQVIDITDPINPTLAGTYDTPGYARGVTVTGGLALVADKDFGLQVIKIKDLIPPALASSNKLIIGVNGRNDIAVAGDLAIITAGNLHLFSITDPTNPVHTGTYDTPDIAQGIAVAGDHAYVADSYSGLQVIDITDPENPTHIGTYDTPGRAFDVEVAGDLAFVADEDSGLQVINIVDPANPTLFGSCSTPGVSKRLTVAGDHVYMADIIYGILIIDITDPANPTHVGTWDPGGNTQAKDVAVAGDFAFLATGSGGLRTVNITDPSNPTHAGANLNFGDAIAIDVEGDFAFMATQDSISLQVIDITDPYRPKHVYSYIGYPWMVDPLCVAVAGDYVYMGTLNGTYDFWVFQCFQHEVDGFSQVGQSLEVAAGSEIISRANIISTETSDVLWEVSADAGANWSTALNNAWSRILDPGNELLWRSTHTWSPGLNPTVSQLTLEWLYEFAPIASIADVPDDQGGWVYVELIRSGYDFADEAINLVTQYGIYYRVENPALIAEVESQTIQLVDEEDQDLAPLPGVATAWIGGTRYVLNSPTAAGTFPPGTWALVATVPATQPQNHRYLAKVSTDTDSSSAGTNYAVYIVTTHTTVPSTWFISYPDSGYSVDNIAPGVPEGFSVAYNTGSGNQLNWDPAPEPDFQYYKIYRDADPDFTPGPTTLVDATVNTSWTDPENDGWNFHYKITCLDHAGNESGPATAGSMTGISEPVIPKQFAVYQNIPNPFNPATRIRYDVPVDGGNVTLQIFNIEGRLVRTLVNEHQSPGQKIATWHGRNDQGQSVATGVYFYLMKAPGYEMTKKMVLLK
jgi:hypothetical protein